jgi:hypothetical protein
MLWENYLRWQASCPPTITGSNCKWCGQGKLDLIDERRDPNVPSLRTTCQVLKCNAPECGKLTIV